MVTTDHRAVRRRSSLGQFFLLVFVMFNLGMATWLLSGGGGTEVRWGGMPREAEGIDMTFSLGAAWLFLWLGGAVLLAMLTAVCWYGTSRREVSRREGGRPPE